MLPLPLEEILARLGLALESSPADSTEILWIDAERGREDAGPGHREPAESAERTVFVQVREAGRRGLHRTRFGEVEDLRNGVRQALAQARLSPPSPAPAPVPADARVPDLPGLADPELLEMTAGRARDLLRHHAQPGESARLGWARGRIALAASHGLRRSVELTSVWLEVACGRGPGAGRAAGASRTLEGLAPRVVFDRARRRQAPPEPPVDSGALSAGSLLSGPVPLALSQESTAALLELLNREALSVDSFHAGTSFLLGRLGEPVFHPSITLYDDATDPRGLPLPFDLRGCATYPVELIAGGIARSPAVDDRLAARTGLAVTPHAWALDASQPLHLFLQPGERPDEEVLPGAEGGLFVGALDALECFEPRALRFRAVARGVRRITGGGIGGAVPDLVWESSLPEVFSAVLGLGSRPRSVPAADPLLGATTAPMMMVQATGLREAGEPAPEE